MIDRTAWIKQSSQTVLRDVLLRHCSRADVLVYHTRGDGRFSVFISVPPGEQEYRVLPATVRVTCNSVVYDVSVGAGQP